MNDNIKILKELLTLLDTTALTLSRLTSQIIPLANQLDTNVNKQNIGTEVKSDVKIKSKVESTKTSPQNIKNESRKKVESKLKEIHRVDMPLGDKLGNPSKTQIDNLIQIIKNKKPDIETSTIQKQLDYLSSDISKDEYNNTVLDILKNEFRKTNNFKFAIKILLKCMYDSKIINGGLGLSPIVKDLDVIELNYPLIIHDFDGIPLINPDNTLSDSTIYQYNKEKIMLLRVGFDIDYILIKNPFNLNHSSNNIEINYVKLNSDLVRQVYPVTDWKIFSKILPVILFAFRVLKD